MSSAQSNVGGRFVGRLRSSPWPVPGWFRAPALRSSLGPGGGVVLASARQRMPAPARSPMGFGGAPDWGSAEGCNERKRTAHCPMGMLDSGADAGGGLRHPGEKSGPLPTQLLRPGLRQAPMQSADLVRPSRVSLRTGDSRAFGVAACSLNNRAAAMWCCQSVLLHGAPRGSAGSDI